MQATQLISSSVADSGFKPIPTTIRDIPPLIVKREDRPVPQEVGQRLAQLAEQLARTHRAAAEAYLSQGLDREAMTHLEAAATFAPNVLEYHNQLGFVRYVQGDDRGAIQAFQTVLSVDPQNADALFNLGMVLFGQQDLVKAEDCFRRALEARPTCAETWNNRGVCLHQLGQVAGAKACFERALQHDGSNADARANLQSLTGPI